nr:unnamed protein product [Callosobruchus analis]
MSSAAYLIGSLRDQAGESCKKPWYLRDTNRDACSRTQLAGANLNRKSQKIDELKVCCSHIRKSELGEYSRKLVFNHWMMNVQVNTPIVEHASNIFRTPFIYWYLPIFYIGDCSIRN